MTLNKVEITGFEYVMDNVFSPVISECKSEIELLLNEDQELKTKIEEKLELIMKNRAIKKALNAELIIEEEKSKEFSGGPILINTKLDSRGKLEKEFESKFTFINSKHHDFISDSHLHVYNRNVNKPVRRYLYSAIEPVGEEVTSYDSENINNDLVLAI